MFSAGQYRSTEKRYKQSLLSCYVSENILFSNINLTEILLLIFLSILDHFQEIKKFVKK